MLLAQCGAWSVVVRAPPDRVVDWPFDAARMHACDVARSSLIVDQGMQAVAVRWWAESHRVPRGCLDSAMLRSGMASFQSVDIRWGRRAHLYTCE